VYDVLIFGLMIVGISSLVVFSYKIFHSRVYPVGIVRKVSLTQEYVEKITRVSDFRTALDPDDLNRLISEGWSVGEIAGNLHLSEKDVRNYLRRDYFHRTTWDLHLKRRLSPQMGKEHYKLGLLHFNESEAEDPDIKKEVSEHGEALKLHDKLLKEIEQRMRKLEVESVEKLQEAAEDTPQHPQMVH